MSPTSRRKKQTSYQLHGHATENVTTTKYLGVNIQDCMRWATHINTITNKANKTLGFLRRNLTIGTKKTKKTVYKVLVRLILQYAATVWEPYTENEISSIEKVQHRVAKWVSNWHRQSTYFSTIMDSLEWPSLHQHHRKT